MSGSELFNREYFEWYNQNDALQMRYPSELAIGFLAKNLRRPGRVVDLGCGSGRHTVLAAELGHEAIGLDISDGGFEFGYTLAKQRSVSVEFRVADMSETGLRSASVDAVICYSAINAHPMEQQRAIAEEIHRILAPEGILLVNFYGEKDGASQRARGHGREIEPGTYVMQGNLFHEGGGEEIPDYLMHVSTEQEIADLLKAFATVRQFDIYMPWGNGSFAEEVKPSHLLYALAKKQD